jgi:hypothetical protein
MSKRIGMDMRCRRCGEAQESMWGNICNQCRANDTKHAELIDAIKEAGESDKRIGERLLRQNKTLIAEINRLKKLIDNSGQNRTD